MNHDNPHRKPGKAIDFNDCPFSICRCDKCAICGFPKHTAVHGPFADPTKGDEPFGHAYIEGGNVSDEAKVWSVQVSQNGWEYVGHAYITAKSVKQAQASEEYRGAVEADGVHIEFDEQIGEIREVKP